MNKYGWFLSGMLFAGIIIDVMFSYYNLGTVNQRVWILILSLLGIGFNIVFLKDSRNN